MALNYKEVFTALAIRAVEQATIDANTFMRLHALRGTAPERLAELMQYNVDDKGQVFGKFVRSMKAAASQAVLAAEQQGYSAGLAREALKDG